MKLSKWIIAAYLVIMPMFYWVGHEPRTSQEFCFQLLSIILVMSVLIFNSKSLKFGGLNACIFAMGVWFMCEYLINNFMGWTIMVNYFLGVSVYLTIIRMVNEEDIKFLLKVCCWVVVISCAYLWAQLIDFDPRGFIILNTPGVTPQCSFFGYEPAFGMYLAGVLPMFLYLTPLAGLIFVPLVLAKSTGAMLAAVSSTLFYYWFRKRITFWIILIPIIIGAVCFIVFYDNPMGMQKTRLNMWKVVVQDTHIKPWGYGLDAFRTDERIGARKYFKHTFNDKTLRVIKKDDGQWWIKDNPTKDFLSEAANGNKHLLTFWDHPHNEYVWLFYDQGYPAVIIFGFFIYFLWRRFYYSYKSPLTVSLMSCILAFGIFSIVQFPFHLARIGHLFPVILGFFYVSTEKEFADS